MKVALSYALARGQEPATYAGLAAVFGALHLSVPSAAVQSISLVLMGGCGIAAAYMKG